ncbi:hypothetical protein BOX37_22405 [Nocardia mangyaensis]|uniref:Secreted protein n=1 Tax=Nocardia mangyaensis TaxID=2213200 RepID=A0A1J0VW39_9NOCA|nr:hypothetical protein [Nocardia mangyaensis]APE36218.1 hypothetical protein BOX37_22405 [Nocardia mangyaensis]
MRKILTRATIILAFATVTVVSAGQASAITGGQCVGGGGVVIHEMDGTKTCIGGFYTGLEILF